MTVCALYCSANGSALLIRSLLDGFSNDLHAILLSGWQRITLSSARQRRSRFTHHFAQRMAPRSLFFHSSTGVMSVCAPYCLQDGSPLLILPLVKGFSDNSRPLLLGWQRIPRSSARQWLSQWFVRLIEQRMAAHCSFFRTSTSFPTVCVPCCSVDVSALLILLLVDGFHGLHTVILVDSYPNGLRAATLIEYRIGWLNASDRRWLSHQITRRAAR